MFGEVEAYQKWCHFWGHPVQEFSDIFAARSDRTVGVNNSD